MDRFCFWVVEERAEAAGWGGGGSRELPEDPIGAERVSGALEEPTVLPIMARIAL